MNKSNGLFEQFKQAKIDLKAAEENYDDICCGFDFDNPDKLIDMNNKINQLNIQIDQSELK